MLNAADLKLANASQSRAAHVATATVIVNGRVVSHVTHTIKNGQRITVSSNGVVTTTSL